MRRVEVGDRRQGRHRGDPPPGAVPAGGIRVAEQPAGRPGQRVPDEHPGRQAGRRRLCRAISTRTGSRSEPDHHATRTAATSATRSAPIEQVRSCTPTPASRRARWLRHRQRGGLLQRLVGEQPLRRTWPEFAHRPAPQPHRLGDHCRPAVRSAPVAGAAGSGRRAGWRRSAAAAAACSSASAPAAADRNRTSSRVNWYAMAMSVGRSATDELRLSRALLDEGRHADLLVLGGEQLGELLRSPARDRRTTTRPGRRRSPVSPPPTRRSRPVDSPGPSSSPRRTPVRPGPPGWPARSPRPRRRRPGAR